jgi:hypothetical protein
MVAFAFAIPVQIGSLITIVKLAIKNNALSMMSYDCSFITGYALEEASTSSKCSKFLQCSWSS